MVICSTAVLLTRRKPKKQRDGIEGIRWSIPHSKCAGGVHPLASDVRVMAIDNISKALRAIYPLEARLRVRVLIEVAREEPICF